MPRQCWSGGRRERKEARVEGMTRTKAAVQELAWHFLNAGWPVKAPEGPGK